MKALLFILALTPFAQAQAQSSNAVCGRVFVSEICDVDFCRVGLAVKKEDGNEDWYGLYANGELVNRDYKITPQIEAMVGKNFCGPRPPSDSFGLIDVGDLVPQQ